MRLTDVDALIDDVKDRYCKDCNRRKGIKGGEYRIIYKIGEAPCKACGVGDMLDELEDAPTVDLPYFNYSRKNGKSMMEVKKYFEEVEDVQESD